MNTVQLGRHPRKTDPRSRGNHGRRAGRRIAGVALFALALTAYVVVIGQNWAIYAAAMMAAAYRNALTRRPHGADRWAGNRR